MKKNILISLIMLSILTPLAVHAFVVGQKPPQRYIQALKLCTPLYTEVRKESVMVYDIKGYEANGTCKVVFYDYINYLDPEIYEGYKMIYSLAAGIAQGTDVPSIPSQQELIRNEKKKIKRTTCYFTDKQIDNLYNSYFLNDGNPTSSEERSDGSVHTEFRASQMSTYDKYMTNYYQSDSCVYDG